MPWSGSTPNQTFTRSNGTHSGDATWAQDEAAAVGITAERHDMHDEDISDGLNATLKRDGGNAMTAALPGFDGTAALPGYSFSSDPDTGIYRVADNALGLSAGGSSRVRLDLNGVSFNGHAIWHAGNDGSGSGLDADTVDGWHAPDLISLQNSTGTLPPDRLAGVYNISISGNADTLDGLHAEAFHQVGVSGGLDSRDGYVYSTAPATTSNSHFVFRRPDSTITGLVYHDHTDDYVRMVQYNSGAFGSWIGVGDNSAQFNGHAIWHAGNDGSGSGLDADTVDGWHAPDLISLQNSTGTLPPDRLAGVYNISISGNAASANNANTLDGIDSTQFARIDAAETFGGWLVAHHAFYARESSGQDNSHLVLQDRASAQRGVLYWGRSLDDVVLRHGSAGPYIQLFSGSVTVSHKTNFYGDIEVDKTWPTLWLDADGDADGARIYGLANNVIRWAVALGDNNAAKDFNIHRYNSAGVWQDAPFQVRNSDGRTLANVGLDVGASGLVNNGSLLSRGDITVHDGSTGPTIVRKNGGLELHRQNGWSYIDFGDGTTDYLMRIQQSGTDNRLNFLWHSGGYADIRAKDIIADRSDGTGAVFLTSDLSRYLWFDGGQYVLHGANLIVAGHQAVTNNNGNYNINIFGSAGSVGGFGEVSLAKRDSLNGNVLINGYANFTSWNSQVAYITGNTFEFHWNSGFFYRIDGNPWVLINSSPSDKKYKELKKYSGNIFDEIRAVKPICFEAKKDIPVAMPEGVRDGFVAQELQALTPSLVQEMPVPYEPEYERDEDGELVLDENGKPIKKPHPLENETFLALAEDAELQLISKLWRAISELIQREQARSGSASPIVDDNRAPTTTDVRAELRRRRRLMLNAETDDDVQDIVLEGNQEAIRLLRIGSENWTAEQAARAADLESFEMALAALKAKANAIASLSEIPADYAADTRWH